MGNATIQQVLDSAIQDLPSLRQVEIALARKEFLEFVTFTWPQYQVNWHHEAIAEQLDKFARGEIKKLMLFVPPQHGKSQLSSRHLPAYLAGLHPNKQITVVSYSDTLAGKFGKAAQRVMDGDEYAEVFPDVKIAKKGAQGEYARNAEYVEFIGHRGALRTVGTGNPITGNSVDIAIIDDPIKGRAEAESPTYREKLWDWYVDELLTRLDNNGQILILLTRWHEDDLAGRLLAQDLEAQAQGAEPEWTVITYPAIKEADYTAPGDPRQPGEALWPEKHSAERILQQKKKSERTYNSLYQQRPSTPEGNLFKVLEIGLISYNDFLLKTASRRQVWDFFIDTAYTEKTKNDASALYASTYWNNDIYIRRAVSVRMEFDALLDYIQSFVKLNGYTARSTIFVEPKANGLSIVQSMKKHTKLNVKKYKWGKDDEGNRMDKMDKVERANSVAPTVNSGRIFLIEDGTGWTTSFKQQVAAFPNSAHDDEVDTFVMDVSYRIFGKRQRGQIVKE